MELTREQIERIEELASFFIPIDEIACLLEIDTLQFRKQALKQGSDIALAYQRGKLRSKVAIYRSVVKMAEMGSPQAQKDVIAFMVAQSKNERP